MSGPAHPFLEKISRREFLKFGLLGFLALGLPAQTVQVESSRINYGRVTDARIDLYDQPSLSAKKVKTLFQDALVQLTSIVQGDAIPAYNRTWYRVNNEAYAHSGGVQPVRINTNLPDPNIPERGCLAEVTVPYSDASWWTGSRVAVAYRLYFATTHWVTAYKEDADGIPHYALYDNKVKATYYAPARHFRLIPHEELLPLSPQVNPQDKHILVNLKDQVVVAYEAGQPVFLARAATGARFSNGDFSTPTGPHNVLYKSPTHHMAAGDRAAANSFDLPGVPWISYITEDGLAFHGTYWHNDFGKPRSHGCINLSPQAARWIYRWTQPVVAPEELVSFADSASGPGTQVTIT